MFILIWKKLHISAYIGHHRVFLPIKGELKRFGPRHIVSLQVYYIIWTHTHTHTHQNKHTHTQNFHKSLYVWIEFQRYNSNSSFNVFSSLFHMFSTLCYITCRTATFTNSKSDHTVHWRVLYNTHNKYGIFSFIMLAVLYRVFQKELYNFESL